LGKRYAGFVRRGLILLALSLREPDLKDLAFSVCRV